MKQAKKNDTKWFATWFSLVPSFFNVYTANIVNTMSKQFIHVDDVSLVAQGTILSEVEIILWKKKFQKCWMKNLKNWNSNFKNISKHSIWP